MRVLLVLVAWVVGCGPVAGQAPDSPRDLYSALNAVRVDSARTYYARDLVLRRDAVSVFLTEGKLAFLERCRGKVVGAVFTGQGRVIAVPRDPIERRSLARYIGLPVLDLTFNRAYLRFTDDSAAEIEQQLNERKATSVDDPAFGQDWAQTVAALNPWHSLRILTGWVSDNHLPYFYAGVQTESHGPVDVLVDQRREEQIGIGQPQWVDGIGYYNLWTAFPARDAELAPIPNAFDPVSYTVETTVRPDLELEGKTVAEVKAVRPGERMITLELSRQLKVESVTDEQGRSLPFFQNEDMTSDEASRRGNDALMVVLEEAPPAGPTVKLTIRYRGQVISDAGNGAFYVGARGSWYPNLGAFNQFSTFDLSFRWPRALDLVATGKRVSQAQEGEWKTGRWVSEIPVPLAGFNLGNYESKSVAGENFVVEVYANRRLEAAMAERFRRNSAQAYAGPTIMGRRRIIVPILPDLPVPSPAAHLEELGNEVRDAIQFNESLSVPFPFGRLAVAQIPGSFGQGWPGLLYLSTLSFLSAGTQARIGASRETQEQYLNLVPPHEVAHQWWGNLVTWPTYRDQWIHEGLANYLALMFADSRRPKAGIINHWLDNYRDRLKMKEEDSDSTLAEAGPLVLGRRLVSSKSSAAYGAVVYGKGTWVVHMLRMMLRDDKAAEPDARFTQLLRTLAEKYQHRGLDTENLQKEVEKLMTPQMDLEGGRSMDWFFDQYVQGIEIPHYSVDYKVARRGQQFVVTGTLKQTDVDSIFVARVPLYADMGRGQLVSLGSVVTSGEDNAFRFTTSASPRKIVIDPQRTVLAFID